MKIRMWIAALIGVINLSIPTLTSAQPTQSWPAMPVRFIVPFPPGGGNDILARIVGQSVSQTLGQPIVVENRPGAGVNIGADFVAKSRPDGYTFLIVPFSILNFNPYLFAKLSFDPIKDFEPVGLLGKSTVVIAVNSEVPASSMKELIALAKSKPNALSYASSGVGTPHHLAGELFKITAGVSILHVPYKGGAPAAFDLISNRVQVMFAPLDNIEPHLATGKVRILAVAGEKRLPSLPDVPTAAEAGLPNFRVEPWYGLVAPAGTPKEIIAKLNGEIGKALAQSDVIKKIEKQGMEPATATPQEFATLIRTGLVFWGKVIKDAGIKPIE